MCGRRYRAEASPVSIAIVSHLANLGMIKCRADHQIGVFKAAVTFARSEGIIPAPEPSYAIKVVIDEALAQVPKV